MKPTNEMVNYLRYDDTQGWVIRLLGSGEVIGFFASRQNAEMFAKWYFGGARLEIRYSFK